MMHRAAGAADLDEVDLEGEEPLPLPAGDAASAEFTVLLHDDFAGFVHDVRELRLQDGVLEVFQIHQTELVEVFPACSALATRAQMRPCGEILVEKGVDFLRSLGLRHGRLNDQLELTPQRSHVPKTLELVAEAWIQVADLDERLPIPLVQEASGDLRNPMRTKVPVVHDPGRHQTIGVLVAPLCADQGVQQPAGSHLRSNAKRAQVSSIQMLAAYHASIFLQLQLLRDWPRRQLQAWQTCRPIRNQALVPSFARVPLCPGADLLPDHPFLKRVGRSMPQASEEVIKSRQDRPEGGFR
mmetsp:Transcript_575/g.2093  ORF Transcript_575/g.2093 Transcript_575/m.2093 type:complete len:298 (-) Transcript_575:2634-3527(-)|eukprot:scaffold7095_cov260-Pinguiococcus_pyrenoidosus.AAC.17